SVTTSQMVTLFKAAVPQFATEPETWNEPAANRTVCGPQILATWMQAVLVTTVTQVADVAEAGPQGPGPVAAEKALTGPAGVRLMVCAGIGTAVWAGTVPMFMVM